VVFNEVKMTYKDSVEKSELLLDPSYLVYEDDDLFQSVRDDDDDDQSVKVDQSVRERENSDPENSETSDQEDLTKSTPSAESPTEVQPVGKNLTPPPADLSRPVGVDQAAPLHAAEDTLVAPADQDDDDELSVLMSDPEPTEQEAPDEMTNQQDPDNRLISEENNPLILNYSRSKIRHDYKQLHHKNFVKSAKIGPIEAVGHGLVILKMFEQAINGPQTKE
jgi:hypothetical protein